MSKGKSILETIEDTFNANKKVRSKSVIEIRGKVVSDIDEDDEFHFMDLSGSIVVKISDKRFLESAFISQNRYIKIIDPNTEVLDEKRYLILAEETQVIPTPKLKLLADANWSKLDITKEEKTEIEKINKLDPDDVSFYHFEYLLIIYPLIFPYL